MALTPEGVACAIATMGVSFVIQSTALIVAALALARFGTRTAAVRVVIYQATFAAIAVLPLIHVLFALSGGVSLAGAVPAAWRRALAPACGILGAVWLVGALAGLLRIAWAHRRMAALRRRAMRLHSPPVIEGLKELVWHARVYMPDVVISAEVDSPRLTGALDPAILLPSSLADCTVDEGLLAVLQHELAHQMRHDCLAGLCADVLCAVFCIQPLLRVLATRMVDAADEAADDVVLSGGATATEYARQLCTWAEARLTPRECAAIGIGRLKSALESRVERITTAAGSLVTKLSRVATGGIAYTMALLCILVALLAIQLGIWLADSLAVPAPRPAVPGAAASSGQAMPPAAPGEGAPHG